MKRILVVTGTTKTAAGGRVLVGWCERLPQLGILPHVAFPGGGSLGDALTALQVPQIHVDLSWPRKIWPIPFWRQCRRLSRQARQWGIELIHALGCNDFPLARGVAKSLRVPVLSQVRWPRERAYCQWMFGAMPQPDRLLCVTESIVRYERQQTEGLLSPESVQVIYNGIDVETEFRPAGPDVRQQWRERYGIAADAFVIGIPAVIQRRKQTDHLIDVVARLRERGIPAVGVMAGRVDEEDYADICRAKIRDSNLEPYIVETGYISEMASAYAMFDVTLSCATTETFGMSVVESMACGCPVVYYRFDVLDEVAGEDAVPVPMHDIAAMADACERLARDSDYRDDLARRGRNRACRMFSSDASVQALARVYEQVCSEARND